MQAGCSVVYFIQAGSSRGYIKIGVADCPERRLADLQTGNAHRLSLVAIVDGGESMERELHAKFKEDHIRGEWFRPMGRHKILEYAYAQNYLRRMS